MAHGIHDLVVQTRHMCVDKHNGHVMLWQDTKSR